MLITKNFPNSFIGTDLKRVLDSNGIKDLLIVGAMTHMCIQGTARTAAELGYNIFVLTEATATKDIHYGDTVTPAKQVATAVFGQRWSLVMPLNTSTEEINRLGKGQGVLNSYIILHRHLAKNACVFF